MRFSTLNVKVVLGMDDFGGLHLFSTAHWDIVLNANQTYLGRSVVLLKRPCANLSEITREELLDFFEIVKKMEWLFRTTLGAAMCNWSCLMNNAYQNDPPDPQVHWHCLPRYDHPVAFANTVFKDPNFGHRSISDVTLRTDDEMSQLVALLQKNLTWA